MPPKTATANTYCLRGEQTVRTIADAHSALAAFYANALTLVIDAAKVTDADLTLVQLIESLRRTAARDGETIRMSAPLPDALRDVLVRGGFLSSPDNALFWTAP